MTQVVSDLVVSVERAYDVDGEELFRALLAEVATGGVERVSDDDVPDDAAFGGPPPGLRAGETYVGDLDVPGDAAASSCEAYFTVESATYPRFVLSGGGDAEDWSFDARIVLAIADVPGGSVVRLEAILDVAGDVAGRGPEPVRARATQTVERYFSRVERALAHVP